MESTLTDVSSARAYISSQNWMTDIMLTVGGCVLPVDSQQPLIAGYILLVVLEIGKYIRCISASQSLRLPCILRGSRAWYIQSAQDIWFRSGKAVKCACTAQRWIFRCLSWYVSKRTLLMDAIWWSSLALNGVNMISAVGVATHVSVLSSTGGQRW